MWKAIFEKVLESCVYMDPTVYMYYVAAKRESELQAEQEPIGVRSSDVHMLRLVEGQRAPREARA